MAWLLVIEVIAGVVAVVAVLNAVIATVNGKAVPRPRSPQGEGEWVSGRDQL